MRANLQAVAAGVLWAASHAAGADSNSLIGIHFWGDRNDPTPATMLNSTAAGGYDLEIVNTDNFAHGGWHDEDVLDPLYQNFKNSYHITPITRLGHYWGETLPAPGTADYISWPSYIAASVAGRMKAAAHLWQMGNEPNISGEASNWTNHQIPPSEYATLYRNVRNAIKTPAVTGAAGAHQLLVAPISPGPADAARWIDGYTWLDQALAAIPTNEVDGVALHAYGGGTARASLQEFRREVLNQINVVDNRGLANVPLYLTEWNRDTQIGNAADEAITAQFARDALKFMDRWNRTPGNHNIVASNWFVYDAGGTWDRYSIEYWKNNGATGSGDLYNAFYDSSRAGYKAGVAGARPVPAGVQIIDDFEGDDGHFASATVSPSTAGTSGVSGGFKVRQNDADSYRGSFAHKIGITDDGANANGWSVRYVSGNGDPNQNVKINLTSGPDGNIGFFLRLYTFNGNEDVSAAQNTLTTQLVMDSGSGGGINTDAGVPRTILADGDWHWYEWSLDDPTEWIAWPVATGSDGKLGVNSDMLGQVSIDSILFNGPNANCELILDTVMRNSTGSLSAMASVPEPNAVVIAVMLAGWSMARRRQ